MSYVFVAAIFHERSCRRLETSHHTYGSFHNIFPPKVLLEHYRQIVLKLCVRMSLFVFCALFAVSIAYPDGAPELGCYTSRPMHDEFLGQWTPAPYVLELNLTRGARTYSTGQSVAGEGIFVLVIFKVIPSSKRLSFYV